MRKTLILPAILMPLLITAQVTSKTPLDELEKKLITGDKATLFKITPYLQSRKPIKRYLGYHTFIETESSIAKFILIQNCLFTPGEIEVRHTTSRQWAAFLARNKQYIFFSPLVNAFMITPLEKRVVKTQFRQLSAKHKALLQQQLPELLQAKWVQAAKIDQLILQKDPRAMLHIAAELYKARRFYRDIQGHQYTQLLQWLTGAEIAVEDEKQQFTWHIDTKFDPVASLNLLIYFAGNYHTYSWSNEEETFINNNRHIIPIGREDSLFQSLNNKNDFLALDAFIRLTNCEVQKIIPLAVEYEKAGIEYNPAIPFFPYRAVQQLPLLTAYCRQHNISLAYTTQIKTSLTKLGSTLSLKEKRRLEDSLVNNLTLDNITAFEYWVISRNYEHEYDIMHSIGRILDIFYSKNWQALVHHPPHLLLYLLKSHLFGQLGIVGSCNNYLDKFINTGAGRVQKLNALQTTDTLIQQQAKKAARRCYVTLSRPWIPKKPVVAHYDTIPGLAKKILALSAISTDGPNDNENKLLTLLSKVNYSQLGTAMRAIENTAFKNAWDKYTFIEEGWCLLTGESFDTITTRVEFLQLYDSLPEYQVYTYYLDKAGVYYKNLDNTLNYDEIYERLKYDAAAPFIGSYWSENDKEVLSLIKLLEITHKNTLGYSHKPCPETNIAACQPYKKCLVWMQYLFDNNLLKQKHDHPISFNYPYNTTQN